MYFRRSYPCFLFLFIFLTKLLSPAHSLCRSVSIPAAPFFLRVSVSQVTVFQAGVDVLASDRLGRLGLTREGLRRRDAAVLEAARVWGSRLVVTMGGGYPRDLSPESAAFREVRVHG